MKTILFCLIIGFSSLKCRTQTAQKGDSIRDYNRYFEIIDTNLSRYKIPEFFGYSDKRMGTKTEYLKERTYECGFSYPNKYNLQDVLQIIDYETNLTKICFAKNWCKDHFDEVFPHLVVRLSIKRKVGLTNYDGLFIEDRHNSGDMTSNFQGWKIQEDIFTVAGRASYILNELTREDFAVVESDLTRFQAKKFKRKWRKYIKENTVTYKEIRVG